MSSPSVLWLSRNTGGRILNWIEYCKKKALNFELTLNCLFKVSYYLLLLARIWYHFHKTLTLYITTHLKQFVIFKPLSYCFKETVGFDVKATFARRPVSGLIKPGDITKKCKKKVIQFYGTFHGLKITNWKYLCTMQIKGFLPKSNVQNTFLGHTVTLRV